MDGQKDIQKTGPLPSFFDTSAVRTNPFGANQSAHRAYRRAERVTAALYLVTNHISPDEPLRATIRSEAVSLFEKILLLRDDMRATDSPNVSACRVSIRHLISLVRMLSVAQLISPQNTNVLAEGLDELGHYIEVSRSSPTSENLSLSREDLLDVGKMPIKDVKDTRKLKDSMVVKDMSDTSPRRPIGIGSDVRKQNIVGVLQGAVELGIRDIASNLPEYSEKMIQRDLLSLVVEGRVKKVGLKRWSRYSIV